MRGKWCLPSSEVKKHSEDNLNRQKVPNLAGLSSSVERASKIRGEPILY